MFKSILFTSFWNLSPCESVKRVDVGEAAFQQAKESRKPRLTGDPPVSGRSSLRVWAAVFCLFVFSLK